MNGYSDSTGDGFSLCRYCQEFQKEKKGIPVTDVNRNPEKAQCIECYNKRHVTKTKHTMSDDKKEMVFNQGPLRFQLVNLINIICT